MNILPIQVDALEGEDIILVAQLRHADRRTSGGLIQQSDYTDYAIKVRRIGSDTLSILSLVNQTPVSDVVETTDRLVSSLNDDALWTLGGDEPGHNILYVLRQSALTPNEFEGGRQYMVTLALDGGTTYGTEYVRWLVTVHAQEEA